MSSLLDQNLLTNCLRVTQEEQPNGSITYFVNHYGERRLQSSIFILGSLQTIGCSCIGARHQLFLAKIFSLKRPSNLEKCSTSYRGKLPHRNVKIWRQLFIDNYSKKVKVWRGRDYWPPRLSSRLRKKRRWNCPWWWWWCLGSARRGHEGHQATKGWPTIKFLPDFLLNWRFTC